MNFAFECKAWQARRKHMDKHIFHLSYNRTEPGVKPWTGYDENRLIYAAGLELGNAYT